MKIEIAETKITDSPKLLDGEWTVEIEDGETIVNENAVEEVASLLQQEIIDKTNT